MQVQSMFGRSDAKRFPRRLKFPVSPDAFRRMAWNPSSCAPHASELLFPDKIVLSGLDVQDRVYGNGLLIGASVSGRALINRGDELFRLGPVREVRLVAVQPFLAELAQSPHLLKLRKLNLDGNQIGLNGLRELLASPYLQQLEALNLSRNGLGDDAIEMLATTSSLTDLRQLDLSVNHFNRTNDSWQMLRERFGAVS